MENQRYTKTIYGGVWENCPVSLGEFEQPTKTFIERSYFSKNNNLTKTISYHDFLEKMLLISEAIIDDISPRIYSINIGYDTTFSQVHVLFTVDMLRLGDVQTLIGFRCLTDMCDEIIFTPWGNGGKLLEIELYFTQEFTDTLDD